MNSDAAPPALSDTVRKVRWRLVPLMISMYVVAYVDKPAHKVYTIGGNVNQAVTARKMNLRRNLTFSASQRGNCGGPAHWNLPLPTGAPPPHAPGLARNCSLNDKKWFVLLQLR